MMMFLNFMCTLNQSQFVRAIGQRVYARIDKHQPAKQIMRKRETQTDRQTERCSRRKIASETSSQQNNVLIENYYGRVAFTIHNVMKYTRTHQTHSAYPLLCACTLWHLCSIEKMSTLLNQPHSTIL